MRALGFGDISNGGRVGIFFGLVVIMFLAYKFLTLHYCPGGDPDADGVVAAAGSRVSPSTENADKAEMRRKLSNFVASQVHRIHHVRAAVCYRLSPIIPPVLTPIPNSPYYFPTHCLLSLRETMLR